MFKSLVVVVVACVGLTGCGSPTDPIPGDAGSDVEMEAATDVVEPDVITSEGGDEVQIINGVPCGGNYGCCPGQCGIGQGQSGGYGSVGGHGHSQM